MRSYHCDLQKRNIVKYDMQRNWWSGWNRVLQSSSDTDITQGERDNFRLKKLKKLGGCVWFLTCRERGLLNMHKTVQLRLCEVPCRLWVISLQLSLVNSILFDGGANMVLTQSLQSLQMTTQMGRVKYRSAWPLHEEHIYLFILHMVWKARQTDEMTVTREAVNKNNRTLVYLWPR